MWRAIWRIELHKTVPYYVVMIAAGILYVLLRQTPLGDDDDLPCVLAVAMGAQLAARIFCDEPGTASFVFSLPLTRARLFWHRWALGVAMIAAADAAIGVVLASGLRQAVQTGIYDSVWYPMVRWQEFGFLWPVAAGALFGYQARMFGAMRWPSRTSEGTGWRRISWIIWIAAIVGFGGLAVLASWAWSLIPGGGGGMETPQRWHLVASPGFIVYLAILTVLTTASCLSYYRRLEIEA